MALVLSLSLSHPIGITEHGVGQGVDARGLPRPGGAADDNVGHVALLGDDLEPVQCLLIADHLLLGFSRYICLHTHKGRYSAEGRQTDR